MPEIYRHPETVCPACGHPLNALAQAGGIVEPGIPQPGDMSVCIQCRSVLELTTLGGYRVLTSAELARLPDDERIDIEATQAHLIAYDLWRQEHPHEPPPA